MCCFVFYHTYSILPVRCSQIPSLLISLSTGILVTKGSNENDFSGELLGQLFGTAKVLYIVSIVLVVLGILTPLRNEWWLFIGLAVAFFVTGKNLDKKAGIESIEDETAQAESDAEEIRKPENVVSLLQVDPIELEFGYGIIPLADVNQGGDLLDRVVMIRRQIALELGTVVPIIRLRDNIQLNPNQYIIKIKGIQVTEGEILFDHYMAMNPGYVEEEITGIPTFEPSFHLPAIWITESQRERAESLGYTVVDPPSIIATHLTEVIRSHIAELLTRQDVQNLVNNLKESNPVIVDELIPKLLGLGEIQKVLQNLLSEGISIRDLLTIFANVEVMFGVIPKYTLADVIYENQTIKSIISNGPLGIDFISAGSSVVGLNNLNHKQIHFIVSAINELNSMYDFIIIDTGAGVSEQVMEFVAASNEIVLVTTPEPTSITDSYSLLKALYKRPDFDPSKVCIRVISNRAASKEDGSIVFNKINSVVMQFLNGSLEYLGYVPSDAMVEKAVRQQKILSIYDPTSKAARSFEEIAKRLLDNESAALDEKRTISHVFSNFFNRKQ